MSCLLTDFRTAAQPPWAETEPFHSPASWPPQRIGPCSVSYPSSSTHHYIRLGLPSGFLTVSRAGVILGHYSGLMSRRSLRVSWTSEGRHLTTGCERRHSDIRRLSLVGDGGSWCFSSERSTHWALPAESLALEYSPDWPIFYGS